MLSNVNRFATFLVAQVVLIKILKSSELITYIPNIVSEVFSNAAEEIKLLKKTFNSPNVLKVDTI